MSEEIGIENDGGVIVKPSPVGYELSAKAVKLMDEFILRNNSDRIVHDNYSELLTSWAANPENRRVFGGFYTPYFRNHEGISGKDEKVVWQFNSSFVSILQTYELISSDEAKTMYSLIANGTDFIKSRIHNIIDIHPELKYDLMPNNWEQPVVIRIMRYKKDTLLSTNPHVDKTAVSSIIWNDDSSDAQCLVFDLENTGVVQSFRAASSTLERPAYIFNGAAIGNKYSDSPVKEMVHAVLPFVGRNFRYSIACFWLLSNHSMKDFSTKVDFNDMEGVARR